MMNLLQELLNGNGFEVHITVKPLAPSPAEKADTPCPSTKSEQKEEEEDNEEVASLASVISEVNKIMEVDVSGDEQSD